MPFFSSPLSSGLFAFALMYCGVSALRVFARPGESRALPTACGVLSILLLVMSYRHLCHALPGIAIASPAGIRPFFIGMIMFVLFSLWEGASNVSRWALGASTLAAGIITVNALFP